MAWVRISDDFYDHPKFDAAGALGIALWVASLAWCNRNLTDGLIPRRTALRLLDFEDAADAVSNADRNAVTNGPRNTDVTPSVARFVAERLVIAGLWVEEGDGFRIHDYLDYQRSAEQIGAEREKNAARQKAFRDRRKPAPVGPESGSDRNAVTNGRVTGAPNPNPIERTTSSQSETRLDVERVCKHLADKVEANGSKRPTITDAWRREARLLIDRDERTVEQILKAIDWCQADPFWRANVRSMAKLRKQYDTLRLKAVAEQEQAHRRAATQPQQQTYQDRGIF
ncbi:hypothetical protein BX265_6140 [Streptomyces sp. TLI_235]|nr:hypothetical protein [Streptomyces sp. TLI_235]PBC71530.1 hypothetical protein BX265_6140 [Streptomyces sp. TLI_235]